MYYTSFDLRNVKMFWEIRFYIKEDVNDHRTHLISCPTSIAKSSNDFANFGSLASFFAQTTTAHDVSDSPDKFLAVQTYFPASEFPALRIRTLALPANNNTLFAQLFPRTIDIIYGVEIDIHAGELPLFTTRQTYCSI